MNKVLMINSKARRKSMTCGKKALATCEECRNAVRAFRDATRKAKTHLELNLAKGVKDNKKDFSFFFLRMSIVK